MSDSIDNYDELTFDEPLDADSGEPDYDAVADTPAQAPGALGTPQSFVRGPASGRYLYTRLLGLPAKLPSTPLEQGGVAEQLWDDDINALAFYVREELQLDVDGRYPQLTVSGTRSGLLALAAHWVASLTKTAPNRYEGPIWFKDGNPQAIPHTFVRVRVKRSLVSALNRVEIIFTGGGAVAFKRNYHWISSYHRRVEFELDTVVGATAVTTINTHDHPNRPAALPSQALSLAQVYGRAGFKVAISPGSGAIPINGANDGLWSDQEMHDAMQIHWSRFADKPQWAMWVLFAALHEWGPDLGGIMFDDIGANHRQGTAIFSDAFIATPPVGDPAPAAWVARMRFWTAAHEMGHAFNLAHSWQKAASVSLPGNPWIALANEPNARSFMNYPYNVPGGETAFFSDFEFRFSDQELLFMRHAPSRFVEMGNANWFTNHGFQEAAAQANPDFELRLSTTMPGDRFAYLQPPVVEVALVNRSARPKLVSGARLSERPSLVMIINPDSGEPRRWLPYARHCGENDEVLVNAGGALFDSIMVGAGRNGWDMTEPGRYTLQAILTVDGQTVYSNQLAVSVAPPADRKEEQLAAELFTPEVGQVLAVNGTRALDGVNAVLAKAIELPDNPVSKIAAVAIATPLLKDFKLLRADAALDTTNAAAADGVNTVAKDRVIEVKKADVGAARKLLDDAKATPGGADALVNAVGHARFLREAPKLAKAMDGGGPGAGPGASIDATTFAANAGGFGVGPELNALLQRKAAGLTN